MIQTLVSDRSNPSLGDGVGLGRSERGADRCDAQVADPAKVSADQPDHDIDRAIDFAHQSGNFNRILHAGYIMEIGSCL